MPEDAEDPLRGGKLDRFDHAPGLGPSGGDEAVAEPADSLVVMRANHEPLGSRGSRCHRARLEPDGVVGELTRGVHVHLGVGEVLLERAAKGDIEDLKPAADRQQRHVPVNRRASNRDLEGVAPLMDAGGVRTGLGAVERRIEVGPAGEHDGVDQVEHRAGV